MRTPENEQQREHARVRANRKRSKTLTLLKRQNMELAAQIDTYLKQHFSDISELTAVYSDDEAATVEALELAAVNSSTEIQQALFSESLVKSLRRCSNYALYGYNGNEIELITNLPCRAKLCFICNWQRQKMIRRKYWRFFDENQKLVEMVKGGKMRVCTRSQVAKYEAKGWERTGEVSYDLMHLMLSVPHDVNGWHGKRFYFKEIITAFNYMRKTKEWLDLVYGGEFGVEATRNDDGYHIHIHALLFVKTQKRSRNLLHKNVLRIWNRLTVNEASKRAEFTEEEKAAILKGNKQLTLEEVEQLNPKGATIIHLESVYYKIGEKKIYRGMGDYERDKAGVLMAVLETISYHFKPNMFKAQKYYPDRTFEVAENLYDIASIIELSPEIYRQQLYSKYGCLFGEKSLNIKEDCILEEYADAAADLEVDMETGEIMSRQFFITNPLNVYAGEQDEIKLSRKTRGIVFLNEATGRGAVMKLYENYAIRRGGRKSKYEANNNE